jgi:hypothetical protein
VPVYHQVYTPGELQFITASTYRRTLMLPPNRFRRFLVERTDEGKKYDEKLDWMYNNPVVRGLVKSPGEWAWSSWRFYYLEDDSILCVDRMG